MEGMEAVVPARPATPPLVSLLSSVPTVVYDDPHLSAGITYEPETCASADVLAGACSAPGDLPDVPVNEGAVVATPYLVHAGDRCSTMGRGERDGRGRATRLLLASQHQSIEHELWNGTVAQDQGYETPFLRDAASVTDLTPAGGPVTPRAALARLEQALGGCRTRPVIHASILGAYYLPEVRLDGAVWLTKKQTIVVPGAGYDGSGPVGEDAPAEGETWLYGTGLVDVRMDPVFTVPDEELESIDRRLNDQTYRAMRYAVASFDPCCHFAIRMVLATDEDALPA